MPSPIGASSLSLPAIFLRRHEPDEARMVAALKVALGIKDSRIPAVSAALVSDRTGVTSAGIDVTATGTVVRPRERVAQVTG